MGKTVLTAALIGAAASIPASKFKKITESPLQRAAEALWPPTEQEKQLVGTDPTGRPDNMPPAVLADRVARRLGQGPLVTPTKLRVQNVIHYTFGALFGAAYGALAEAFPAATAGAGTVAGAGVYAASHGTALPLLRIQERPWRLPRAAFAWEFVSHLLFGLALELGRRSASRVLAVRSSAPSPGEDGRNHVSIARVPVTYRTGAQRSGARHRIAGRDTPPAGEGRLGLLCRARIPRTPR
jgi:putative membrane protein